MPDATPQPSQAPGGVTHIGLLAGEGAFPVLLAQAARARSVRVTAFGLRGVTSPDLERHADAVHYVELGRFDELMNLLHKCGVTQMIMAGRVKHASIFQLFKLDRRGLKMAAKLANWKANSVLGVVTQELAEEGIEVLDSTMFLRGCMPAKGLLTPGCPPSDELMKEIEFGLEHARGIAALDIGQSVAVKQQSVVAAEAMEGTDAMIERAGQIAGPGIVLVKVSKPAQDKRFDVPVMGLTTVKKLIEAKAAALAFPGGEVLFFDQAEAVALAEKNHLTIIAV